MRTIRLIQIATAVLLAGTASARADFTFTLSELSGDVVFLEGQGSWDLAGLTEIQTPSETPLSGGFLVPQFAATVGNGDFDIFDIQGFTGASPTFGSGSGSYAVSGTGDPFGFDLDFWIVAVPEGYVSGNLLSGTGTYTGSFSSLGITPGSYSWTSTGGQTVFLTAVIPEPRSGVLLLGAVVLGLGMRRRVRSA